MPNPIRVICIHFDKTPFYKHGEIEFKEPGNEPPDHKHPGECATGSKLLKAWVFIAIPFFEDTTDERHRQINAHELEWRKLAEKIIREKIDPKARFSPQSNR